MKRDDQPPPMPPRPHEDATLVHHGALPDEADAFDALPDLPDAIPGDLPPQIPGGTGAKVTLRAIDEAYALRESTHEREVRQQHNQERRMPVEARHRPTLMPSGFDAPPKLPSAPREANPALVRPGPARPSEVRESSDVIQMFPAGAQPQSVPQYQKPRTVPPPPQQPPQGKLIRRGPPQGPGHPTANPQAGYRPPPPQPAMAPPPQVLPLGHDRMAALVADHRARLQTLDLYARGLEIGAGLFGTVTLAVLIASMVSILLGNGQSLVVAGTAIVAGVVGLGVTALMVAMAALLRQTAANTAQIAALIEALATPPR